MPMRVTALTPATISRDYESPFVGPVDHTFGILVNIAVLTTREVDSKGYLKPGVPFTKAGALVGAGGYVWGVTVEEVKVGDGNTAPLLTAAGIREIAVATEGSINQDVAEDMLGAPYTANEIAGFNAAGSKITLV